MPRKKKSPTDCIDCHGYAPHRNGQPLWPGPRCTECAKKEYSARMGCPLEKAEMCMLQERAQTALAPRPVRETGSLVLAPTWALGPEHPLQRFAANSTACNALEVLTVLIGRSEVAHALWQHYGSWRAIANASALELVRNIRGLGARRAAQLQAACELGRRTQAEPPTVWPVLHTTKEAVPLLQPLLQGKDQEHLYVVVLNARNRVLTAPIEVYRGSLSTVLLRTGEVFRAAVKLNAARIIVAHNHPSGDPTPSLEDIKVTRALRHTGKVLDIHLADHLILGHEQFVSLKERGVL